ncbi:GL22352 [Drosophila persimilis]|uniref:GL22352 n=1 Tax=Drosophila persimilis TaxID=7234 RepID=B4GDX9_DROPE|nr:GL22352 [Drosophila persimilis]
MELWRMDELCLVKILKCLALPDQLAMLQTFQRCRPLLGRIWRSQLTEIKLNLLEVPLHKDDFDFLLTNGRAQLNELRLNYLGRDHFEVLVGHRFPQLRLLEVDLLPPFFLCPRLLHQLGQTMPLALVNFDHFQILRAIGKGSFGKVCIVQKRDSGILYAMKYVSRSACEMRGALGGVIKEVELLSSLEHPFLVEFSEQSVALLVCELGSALEYLQTQRVVHRDIKPDNILLDDGGHAHLTDFNIATRLQKDAMACSMSGTKPYMAPEVFLCALDEVAGYSYPVDWWSLGVVAYEMRSNVRPFVVHSNTPLAEIKNILNTPVHYPRYWSSNFIDLLQKLLSTYPGGRISTQHELHQTPLLRNIDFQQVLDKKIKPIFKPPEDHLNCDPCLELEEMIVETRPLHKKKKRLAKQRSAQRDSDPETVLVKEFIVYNRYKELKRKAMEQKENDWQRELELAMANSIVNSLAPIQERPASSTSTSISHATNPAITTPTPTPAATNSPSGNARCTACKESDSIEFIDRTPSPQGTGGGATTATPTRLCSTLDKATGTAQK